MAAAAETEERRDRGMPFAFAERHHGNAQFLHQRVNLPLSGGPAPAGEHHARFDQGGCPDAHRLCSQDPIDHVEISRLAEQDRDLWNADQIDEGVSLITATLGKAPIGPYQLQAAIAAIHDEATSAEETDWQQILALYEVLEQVSPGPVVTLNRAVAVAMVDGPSAGLALLGTLDTDDRMRHTHRLEAVRGHLLELAGDPVAARESYRLAARMTASIPEQRYLALRAARLR